MKMYIAEKQSLGRTVAQALGGGNESNGYIDGGSWRVYFCQGHILEMLEPKEYDLKWEKWDMSLLPIVPTQWQMKPKKNTMRLFKLIQAGLKEASMVINVGDADREGQLLVDEVLEYCGWNGETKRLWFPDQSQAYINKNIDDLKDNADYQKFTKEALARGRADWLIGLNATRAYTLIAKETNLGFDDVLSLGRVQTALLGLLHDRHQAINTFKPEATYGVSCEFKHANGNYDGKLIIDEALKDEGSFKNKDAAEDLLSSVKNHSEGVISDYTKKEAITEQPICYSKSDLVKPCYENFGYDGDEVLTILQTLYDEPMSAVTYPRTDCGYLPEAKHGQAPGVLQNLSGIGEFTEIVKDADPAIKSVVWDDSKIVVHDGLIPTETVSNKEFQEMNEKQRNVFRVIVTRYVAQFYPPKKIEKTDFLTNVGQHQFQSSGQTMLETGWTKLYPQIKDNSTLLPSVASNDSVEVLESGIKEGTTKAPAYFNDGNIEMVMKNIGRYMSPSNGVDFSSSDKAILKENEGIGEESTRSNIVKLLKKRKYIMVSKGRLLPTDFGTALIKAVVGNIKSPIKTALMERDLAKVASGDLTVDGYVDTQAEYTRQIVAEAKDAVFVGLPINKTVKCPSCDDGVLSKRKSQSGYFWGCSGYSTGDCKEVYSDLSDNPYIDKFDCSCGNGCDGQLNLVNGKYGQFFKCSKSGKIVKCEGDKPKRDEYLKGYSCVKCGSGLLVGMSKKKKPYYKCEKAGCGFFAVEGREGPNYNDGDKWVSLEKN